MICECKKTIREPEEKKELEIRINKIIGQLNGVKKMVNEDRYCPEIMMQLLASQNAIKSLASTILKRHLHTCLKKAVKSGDEKVLDEIDDIFRRFI